MRLVSILHCFPRFGSPFTRSANALTGAPDVADRLCSSSLNSVHLEGHRSPASPESSGKSESSTDTWGDEESEPDRNLVVWQGASEETSWDNPDDTSMSRVDASHGPTFERGLGEVRYCVRDGRKRAAGYSVRAARLTDDGLLVPLPDLASSPRCQDGSPWVDTDTVSASTPMTLHNW